MRLFVDNLCNIDFSYLDTSRGLVGETWLASVELFGELDDQGMVCDFGVVKSMLRQWLDQEVDHRLLVPTKSRHLHAQSDENKTRIEWRYRQEHQIVSTCPTSSLAMVGSEQVTEDSVAKWCIQRLKHKFPASVRELRLTFTAEDISGPYYHYSHGLKKHDGNCQRIAHGHRSRILIWRNGVLAQNDMQVWADRWRDIYIGSSEDIHQATLSENIGFHYQAQQGNFSLELPRSQCYMIDTDSTIEFIALHIAQKLKEQYPTEEIRVKAFEGLAKGAIADA